MLPLEVVDEAGEAAEGGAAAGMMEPTPAPAEDTRSAGVTGNGSGLCALGRVDALGNPLRDWVPLPMRRASEARDDDDVLPPPGCWCTGQSSSVLLLALPGARYSRSCSLISTCLGAFRWEVPRSLLLKLPLLLLWLLLLLGKEKMDEDDSP